MTQLPAPLITLTTDFGTRDTYVGVMKGVILGIAPNARMVDLTHEISPQNLVEASARLEAAVPYFPPDAIHVVVVDPGVGTDRATVIVRTEASIFVAPDNGVLTLPLARQQAVETIKLSGAARPYLRHPVSSTFHGRDVFAPVAAHLGAGLPPARFGLPCPSSELVTLSLPTVEFHGTTGVVEACASVLYEDRFGNLITSLTPDAISGFAVSRGEGTPANEDIEIAIGSSRWQGVVSTFAGVAVGAPLAYWGSGGRLEIAVRNGNAAQILGAAPEDRVYLRWRVDGRKS